MCHHYATLLLSHALESLGHNACHPSQSAVLPIWADIACGLINGLSGKLETKHAAECCLFDSFLGAEAGTVPLLD